MEQAALNRNNRGMEDEFQSFHNMPQCTSQSNAVGSCMQLVHPEMYTTAQTQCTVYLHQQIRDMPMKNAFEMNPNTSTSFLNMSTASAPIHKRLVRVKYCVRAERLEQSMGMSTGSVWV